MVLDRKRRIKSSKLTKVENGTKLKFSLLVKPTSKGGVIPHPALWWACVEGRRSGKAKSARSAVDFSAIVIT